jgi:hypothetical protein
MVLSKPCPVCPVLKVPKHHKRAILASGSKNSNFMVPEEQCAFSEAWNCKYVYRG